MKTNTSHYDVTDSFWADPQPVKALETGLQQANRHLHPGSCPAVSDVITSLLSRLRVWGQQIGPTGVPKKVAVVLS